MIGMRSVGIRLTTFSLQQGFYNIEGSQLGARGRLAMAKVIEFHIPKNFSNSVRRLAGEERGRVIEFTLPKKSA